MLKNLLKDFVIILYHYFVDFERLRALTQLTWLILLFLSTHTPNLLQCKNEYFIKLCHASKLFEHWVCLFIYNKLYDVSDFSDYLKIKAAETMPEVTPSIFGEVIEVILTLE